MLEKKQELLTFYFALVLSSLFFKRRENHTVFSNTLHTAYLNKRSRFLLFSMC